MHIMSSRGSTSTLPPPSERHLLAWTPSLPLTGHTMCPTQPTRGRRPEGEGMRAVPFPLTPKPPRGTERARWTGAHRAPIKLRRETHQISLDDKCKHFHSAWLFLTVSWLNHDKNTI